MAYCRVSTQKQDLTNQIEQIKKWADANSHAVTFFKEKVSSIAEREKFNEMIGKLDEFDGIVVTSLSRFGRLVKQLSTDFYELQQKNKKLIILDMGLDTSTKMGKAIFHVMSAMAELDREITYENFESGKERARERGVTFGRKPKNLPMTDEEIAKHYVEGHASYDWLAYQNKTSRETIWRRLDKMGVIKNKRAKA